MPVPVEAPTLELDPGQLRELWSERQRLSAEEMIRDVTGGELEMTSIADRIRENLAPLLGR